MSKKQKKQKRYRNDDPTYCPPIDGEPLRRRHVYPDDPETSLFMWEDEDAPVTQYTVFVVREYYCRNCDYPLYMTMAEEVL